MQTYRDERHGFGLDLTDDWRRDDRRAPLLPKLLFRLARGWWPRVDIEFARGTREYLNVNVEAMTPEPSPEMTRQEFSLHAQREGYSDVSFGRIVVGGKAHTWARYRIADKVWLKKYMLVVDGKGYAVTASCEDDGLLTQRENDWDAIVASFQFPPRADRMK